MGELNILKVPLNKGDLGGSPGIYTYFKPPSKVLETVAATMHTKKTIQIPKPKRKQPALTPLTPG